MFASCASCRMRSNMRALNDSLSRPSSSNAFARAALALVESSPCTNASTARRTRSNASPRVRRSPLLPMCPATAEPKAGVAAACVAATDGGAATIGASAASAAPSASTRGSRPSRSRKRSRPRPRRLRPRRASRSASPSVVASTPGSPVASACAGAPMTASPNVGVKPACSAASNASSAASCSASAASCAASRTSPSTGVRSNRSRPRPRRPRRLRRSSRSRSLSSRRASAGAAALGLEAGATLPSGVSISSWPLSSFVTLSSPFWAASWTKRENFGMPRFFSSNDASISCMTCLSRSERITSPLRFMRFTDSVTSAHGSQRVDSSSPVLVRPASALYE